MKRIIDAIIDDIDFKIVDDGPGRTEMHGNVAVHDWETLEVSGKGEAYAWDILDKPAHLEDVLCAIEETRCITADHDGHEYAIYVYPTEIEIERKGGLHYNFDMEFEWEVE